MLVEDSPSFKVTCSVTGTAERTSTSCAKGANPDAVTVRWYGLNGTFVNLKAPSASVVAARWKPLTGYETSTVAPATRPPEGSFTTPSSEPEFPNCALAGRAATNKTSPNTENT